MEPWLAKLREGDSERAWDLFVERYMRLIFATIKHYAEDYDDIMDVFARVCEALRENDLARLRRYAEQQPHRARFSSWLGLVVRNLTIDWYRHREGRKRLSHAVGALPLVQQKIVEYVFQSSRSHLEAYELIRTRDAIDLSFGEFPVNNVLVTWVAENQWRVESEAPHVAVCIPGMPGQERSYYHMPFSLRVELK